MAAFGLTTTQLVTIVVGVLSPAAAFLVYRLQSLPTAKEQEDDLSDKLNGETIEATAPSGTEYSLKLDGENVEVCEYEGVFYRLKKPVVGFCGETQIEVHISGAVHIEELVLVKNIGEDDRLSEVVADLQLEGDRLLLALNTASTPEVRDILTGVSEKIEIALREPMPEESVRRAEDKVLGEIVAGGIARPMVIAVDYPDRHVWWMLGLYGRLVLENIIGEMNRTYLWVRHTPRSRSSSFDIRFLRPNNEPERYQLGPIELLSFLNPWSETAKGSRRVWNLLYSGYGITREFLETDGEYSTVNRDGTGDLRVSMAQPSEQVEDPRDEVGVPEVKAALEFAWEGTEETPDRREVFVPVEDVTLDEFEDICALSDIPSENVGESASDTGLFAEAITTVNGRTVRCYYRGKGMGWYIAVEWLPDGTVKLHDTGKAKPETPIETQGHVLWNRIHLGRERGYYGVSQQEKAGYYIPE